MLKNSFLFINLYFCSVFMKQSFLHIKKILLLLFALQILNNGLFAQDVLGTAGESDALHSISNYVNNHFDHKKQSSPKHHQKQHKQHRHTLKQSSVKFINHPNFSFQEFETTVINNSAVYYLHLTSYSKNITPPPPKA